MPHTQLLIKTKRPGYGIQPVDKKKIIGKYAKKNIPEDHWISWDMINWVAKFY